VNVKKDAAGMTRMLRFSHGQREVPVIVDGEQVTVGYGGS
jgi:hypothetical protein